MNKKRIKTVIFSSYDDVHNPYYAGGGAWAIHEVARELSSSYKVIIFTGNYPGAKNHLVDKIMYHRVGPANIGPKAGQLLFHILLPGIIKKEQFDVWIESFTPPFSTTSLQKYTSKPVIGLAHMLSSEDMQRKYKLPFHIIERRGLRTYNHFITITEKTKQLISLYNKNAQFYVIPNGVSSVHKKSVEKSEGKYILFLGRIEMNQKGLDLLLEAYAQIKDRTECNLVIAGSGTKKEETLLKKYIAAKNLEKRIVLPGRVDGREREKLLQHASLVAIPSRYETFGNVVLEAMAYHKASIAFAIDGLQWVPTECMIKVKQFDTGKFAKALLTVLTDEKKMIKMGEAAGKVVKSYSWQQTAKAYERVIRSVL